MSAPKLTTYRFRVFGGNEESPEEYIIHGVGRDIQKTESFFADRGWGSTTSRPMTSAAVTSYFALVRSGRYAGTWDEFEEWYLSIEPMDAVTERPTAPGREPGSQ